MTTLESDPAPNEVSAAPGASARRDESLSLAVAAGIEITAPCIMRRARLPKA
jgi:hypothetical protein